MCNLYAHASSQAEIRNLAGVMVDLAGNLPSMPGIFPDQPAPIVRNQDGGRTLALARWGMPSPAFALRGRSTDPGVTNIRNVASPHWRRWLGVGHRCAVPFTSFSEHQHLPDGSRPTVWFALDDTRPLAFFAGLWCRHRSVRRLKEGEVEVDAYGSARCRPCGEELSSRAEISCFYVWSIVAKG